MHILLFILVLAVVFVNGWTDAPNAITCIVSTGTLSFHKAVRMAAACNLLGILVMGYINASVADTVTGIVRLDYSRPEESVAVLCGAMTAIVLFGVAAWYFGIPTSESHALIAALTGAAVAQGRWEAVNPAAWGKVLYGLGLSLVLGLSFGWMFTRLLGGLLRRGGGRAADTAQIVSGAGMAFMHGAQDGQKFVAVFVLADFLAKGKPPEAAVTLRGHIPEMVLCGAVMALGTIVGGKRIIAHVGGRMVELQKHQGACADLGGSLCLLLASLWGIPMSTTHAKTTAIMGAGLAGGTAADFKVMGGIFATWLFTFPVCGMIGYLAAGFFAR